MEDLTGRQFGPYRILEPLGEGGMAAVYKAYQSSVDRTVALKVLPRQLTEEAQFVRRFEQEARLLASLQHPHILSVFDFGGAGGYTYIAMPYVETGTLADRLQGQRLPLEDAGRIISQVGDALDYAHSQGLVHRDVKPSNILVDERGNCLLTDFGIAKLFEGTLNLTGTGRILGTPSYMSPEQGQGNPVDHRSDIYALGIVLYEMVTGRTPFKAETPIAVILKHIQDPLPLPHTFVPGIPPAVERVILKALAKEPGDRFSTAGDMVDALQAALKDGRQTDTVLDAPALEEKRRGRPPVSRAMLAAVLLLLLIFGGAGGFWWFTNNDPADHGATPGAPAVARAPVEAGAEAAPTATGTSAPAAEPTATPSPSPTTPISSPTPAVQPATVTEEAGSGAVTGTSSPGAIATNPVDGATLVYVPAGPFTMGLTGAQADLLLSLCEGCEANFFLESTPARTVNIDAFYIYGTEVTNEMYAICVAGGACSPPEGDHSNTRSNYWDNPTYGAFPVVNVSWFAAEQYCRWAGARLPTEAEWEKAARGADGRLFPWGDQPPASGLANVDNREGDTMPVGSFPRGASPYGVDDMAGNVWEWVADWFERGYFEWAPSDNPAGPEASSIGARVGKGGSWYWQAGFASSGYHDWWEPENAGTAVGFRCAVDR